MLGLIVVDQAIDQAVRVVVVEHDCSGRLLIQEGNQLCYRISNTAGVGQDTDEPPFIIGDGKLTKRA